MLIQREERKFRDIHTYIHAYVQTCIVIWDQNRRTLHLTMWETCLQWKVTKKELNRLIVMFDSTRS